MLKSKKFLSILLAVMMLVQTLIVPGIAAEVDSFVDFPVDSWSTEAMTAAVENGLLVGTSETTIEPEKNLTRAEFAAIITRAFGATKTADISKFSDVAEKDWFYDSVAKAVQMGVMNGTGDTTFDPNAFMKREDVILSLARVLFVDGTDTSVLNQFSDRNDIDTWAIAGIAGMVAEDYVNGYEDGTIRPKNFITRQELAQLFHNMFKTYISEEGDYSEVAAEGSVIVRSKDVTLHDVTINGDLVLADGIGEGDFRLTNVTVKGKIIARGGEGTVYFTNVSADGRVIINDPNGTVNFHNYRDEAPFRGNLTENTPATFLERKSLGGTSVGTSNKIYFYDGSTRVGSFGKNDEIDVSVDDKEGLEFAGWARLQGETDLNKIFTADEIDEMDFSDAKGKWYAVYYTVVSFYENISDTVPMLKLSSIDGNEVITGSIFNEIPSDDDMDTVPGKIFRGWTNGIETYLKSGFENKKMSDVNCNWYPVYVDAYTVSFKYVDGTEALPSVTNSEDYILTENDVKDVENNISPDDYEFLGWTETVDGTDYKSSAELRVSVKLLDGRTYYAQFKKITDNYSVAFRYTDGTEALPTVTKLLAPSEDYTLTDADVKDVDYHTNPDDYEFLGWTDTVNGTNYVASATLKASLKSLDGKIYYAQFRKVTAEYTVSFKYTDGTEALPSVTKDLAASEDYTLTDADVKDVEHNLSPDDYEFLGWTETVDGTDYVASATLKASLKSLNGKTYYAQFKKITDNYSVAFKYTDGTEALPTVEKTLAPSEDYTLNATDVKDVEYHTNPGDYEFLGWTETVDGTDYKTSASLQASLKSLDGKTYYAQFKKLTEDYTVSFLYTDGSEALPAVEKTLAPSEDYTLTATDVKDVEYHTNPGDYEFLGWTETVDGTDYKTSASLQESIKTLNGKTYYAQFRKLGETYKVSFLYTNGDEALPAVENTLAPSEDYTLTANDVKDVEHFEDPEMYEFLGWTETVDGTDYVTSASLQVSIKTLNGKTYYAQFKHVDAVEYHVEHYFQQLDGSYAIDDTIKATEILYEFPGLDVTATPVAEADLPDGYSENTTHADRVAEGTVLDEENASYPLTLKLYYDLEVITVVFNAMWEDDYKTPELETEIPGMTYFVRYGGNIDDYFADGKTNEEIQKEIAEYVEENYEIGYSKDYNNAYLYNELDPETDDGLYEHRINYNWYVETDEDKLGFVLYDEEEAVTEDLNIFIKLKKLYVEITFPEKITNETLPINIPYDEYTRFVDSVRDLVYVNENIAGFPELIGLEAEIYEKISDVDRVGQFFENGSLFNDENELNDVSRLIRFSQLMGEKNFESFLESFYQDNEELTTKLENYLKSYIKDSDTEETADHLKAIIDDLIENDDHKDDATTLINRLAKDILEDEEGRDLVENFFMDYVSDAVKEKDAGNPKKLNDLIVMVCEMLVEYKSENLDNFVGFVTDIFVETLSDDEPNPTIKKMVTDYISDLVKSGEFDSEIAAGSFDDDIKAYINGLSKDEFVDKAVELINKDKSILNGYVDVDAEAEKTLREKLGSATDASFRNDIIDEIFKVEGDTVDNKIKSYINVDELAADYINDYAKDYIENHPDEIVGLVPDSMWQDMWEATTDAPYDPSLLDYNRKLQAVNDYIAKDATDGTVATLLEEIGLETIKNHIGESTITNEINKYYDENRNGTVKAKLKEVLSSDGSKRTDFTNYVISILNGEVDGLDEFEDVIQAKKDEAINNAIKDYLGDLFDGNTEKTKAEFVNGIIETLRGNSDIVSEAIDDDMILNYVINDIVTKQNDDDDSTNSDFIKYIKDYVLTIDKNVPEGKTGFETIVEAILTSKEKSRNSIIKTLFDNVYALDPEHKLLYEAMMELSNEMIENENIDVRILEAAINYIKTEGTGADHLVNDIVSTLLSLEFDLLLEYAKNELGFDSGSDEIDAVIKFKEEATYEKQFEVTDKNLFIMEMVDEKVKGMTFDAFLEDFVAGKVPEKLLDRIPLGKIEQIYNESIKGFTDSLEDAIAAVEAGEPGPHMVNSGVVVRINLVSDILIPGMTYAETAHEKAVNKAVASGNGAAELVEKYYVENPYVIGSAGNKGVVNYAFDPSLYVSDEDGDGFYTINSFKDIYTGVVMPESVETIDALLWMMDDEGGAFPFEKIKKLALDNEDLILALYNHPNKLMARYAEEGLPEDLEAYYDDLLEDDEIRKAVEKLDNKVDFDMMFFVEEKLQNKTLEMYYLKVLERFGVKVDVILEKYTGSAAYREFTKEQFEKIVDEIDLWWGDDEVTVDGEETKIENYYGTTDYAFDTYFEKIIGDDNVATISVKGFEMTVTRFFADYLSQAAPKK